MVNILFKFAINLYDNRRCVFQRLSGTKLRSCTSFSKIVLLTLIVNTLLSMFSTVHINFCLVPFLVFYH